MAPTKKEALAMATDAIVLFLRIALLGAK